MQTQLTSAPPKILIVGPAWVGDMVMAQSLFKLLKMQFPEALIDVLAPAWSQPLIERMPEVSKGIIMPFEHGQLELKGRYRLAQQLKQSHYTQAIVLPNSFKSALIPFLAGIPKRTGWLGEARWWLLNDIRYLNKQKYPLMVERYLALGLHKNQTPPKDYLFPILQSTKAMQAQVLTTYQVQSSGKPILALCPGAEFGPSKRWPEDYFAEVANEKIAAGWDVWLLGSPKDMPVSEYIMNKTQRRCVNFTGRTKLVDAIDLLSMSSAVIANDSGLMHIAAAVQKPLIAIYGSTSDRFTPPLNEQAKVLKLSLPCQPCFQRECPLQHHLCMRDLKPAMVLTALQEQC